MPTMTAPKKPVPEPKPLTPTAIRAAREAHGLSQAEAARRVLVSQSVWSAWERGDRKPSRQSLLLIHLLKAGKI